MLYFSVGFFLGLLAGIFLKWRRDNRFIHSEIARIREEAFREIDKS